jgi:hypothetical protein
MFVTHVGLILFAKSTIVSIAIFKRWLIKLFYYVALDPKLNKVSNMAALMFIKMVNYVCT